MESYFQAVCLKSYLVTFNPRVINNKLSLFDTRRFSSTTLDHQNSPVFFFFLYFFLKVVQLYYFLFVLECSPLWFVCYTVCLLHHLSFTKGINGNVYYGMSLSSLSHPH